MTAAATVQVQEPVQEEKKPRLSLAFRAAAQRDIKPMAKVFARAFGAHNEFNRPIQYLAEARNDDDHRLIVAEAPDGKIAGFVMTDFNSFVRRALYIDQLAVDPDYQGQGVGRSLMEKAEQLAVLEKFNAVSLHVRADNDKAIHLYESMGFKVIGTAHGYYNDGMNGLKMKKSLLPEPANDNRGWGITRFIKKALGLNS